MGMAVCEPCDRGECRGSWFMTPPPLPPPRAVWGDGDAPAADVEMERGVEAAAAAAAAEAGVACLLGCWEAVGRAEGDCCRKAARKVERKKGR